MVFVKALCPGVGKTWCPSRSVLSSGWALHVASSCLAVCSLESQPRIATLPRTSSMTVVAALSCIGTAWVLDLLAVVTVALVAVRNDSLQHVAELHMSTNT